MFLTYSGKLWVHGQALDNAKAGSGPCLWRHCTRCVQSRTHEGRAHCPSLVAETLLQAPRWSCNKLGALLIPLSPPWPRFLAPVDSVYASPTDPVSILRWPTLLITEPPPCFSHRSEPELSPQTAQEHLSWMNAEIISGFLQWPGMEPLPFATSLPWQCLEAVGRAELCSQHYLPTRGQALSLPSLLSSSVKWAYCFFFKGLLWVVKIRESLQSGIQETLKN